MVDKLLKVFRVKSLRHLTKIFFVFGITGSLSVYISGPILNLLQLDKFIDFQPLYWLIRILVITLAYQCSLLIIAAIFGEFKYFLVVQKRFINRLRLTNRK